MQEDEIYFRNLERFPEVIGFSNLVHTEQKRFATFQKCKKLCQTFLFWDVMSWDVILETFYIRAYLYRRREPSGIFRGSYDEGIGLRLSQVFVVQILGEFDHPSRGADVEGACPFTLRPKRVADFAVGKRLGLHLDDARGGND